MVIITVGRWIISVCETLFYVKKMYFQTEIFLLGNFKILVFISSACSWRSDFFNLLLIIYLIFSCYQVPNQSFVLKMFLSLCLSLYIAPVRSSSTPFLISLLIRHFFTRLFLFTWPYDLLFDILVSGLIHPLYSHLLSHHLLLLIWSFYP